MKLLWTKGIQLFIKDWASSRFVNDLDLEIIVKSVKVPDLVEFKKIKLELNSIKSLNDLLLFLSRGAYIPATVALEVGIRNNLWDLVKELAQWQEIKFCYLGVGPKYHLHEVIFSQLLTLLSQDKLQSRDFSLLVNLEVSKSYLGNSLFFKLKQMFVEELRSTQHTFDFGNESPRLKVFIEFFFFLKDQGFLSVNFFDNLIEDIISYRNFYALRYFEPFLTVNHTFLALDTLRFNYIKDFFHLYTTLFQGEKYLKFVIQSFMKDCTASEKELYLILDWMRSKNLDDFAPDNSLVLIVVNSDFHSSLKVPLLKTLMSFNVIPYNEYLLVCLKEQTKINPLIMEALSSGTNDKDICQHIFGCKSGKARQKLMKLVETIREERSQNYLMFHYISNSKLKINRDLAMNIEAEASQLSSLKTDTISKILFILKFYKPLRQLKLLQTASSQQTKEIESSFQTLSIIEKTPNYPYKLPEKPKTFWLMEQELQVHRKNLEAVELSLGIDRLADEFEKREFQCFKLKIPRTAREIMQTGKDFRNCLHQSHHSVFVSKILHRELIILTLYGEQRQYCVSFNPYKREVVEAKALGQEYMSNQLREALISFLKELNFGQDWLAVEESSRNIK